MPRFAIGPFVYRTKKEAEEAVRRVLHGTEPGSRLSGSDEALVRALVERHPDAERKTGCGIEAIEVRIFDYGQPAFWIVRPDGTSTDFSYKKALTAPSHRTEVLSTMRRAVADQITEFRDAVFAHSDTVLCPLTGEPLDRSFGQVDHDNPQFVAIAEEFAAMAGGWDQIELVSSDLMPGKEFRHQVVHQGWQLWHRQVAVLRYIHPSANSLRGVAR